MVYLGLECIQLFPYRMCMIMWKKWPVPETNMKWLQGLWRKKTMGQIIILDSNAQGYFRVKINRKLVFLWFCLLYILQDFHFFPASLRFLQGWLICAIELFSLSTTWFLAFHLLLLGLAVLLSPHAAGTEIASATKAQWRHESKPTQIIPFCFSSTPDVGKPGFQCHLFNLFCVLTYSNSIIKKNKTKTNKKTLCNSY